MTTLHLGVVNGPTSTGSNSKSDLKPKPGLKMSENLVQSKNVYGYCLHSIKMKLVIADKIVT